MEDLRVAYERRWTVQDEMAATSLDLLHELLRQTIAVNTPRRKQGTIPKQWRWPRPYAATASKKKSFSWRAFAQQLGG